MTNGDKIRAMSDGDFAKFYAKNLANCFGCPAVSGCPWKVKIGRKTCIKRIEDWLKQEAKLAPNLRTFSRKPLSP